MLKKNILLPILLLASIFLSANDIKVAISPLSIEDTIELEKLVELETHRQMMILECMRLNWSVLNESSWNVDSEYKKYPISRLFAYGKNSDIKIYIKWIDNKEYIQIYNSYNKLVGEFIEPSAKTLLKDISGKLSDNLHIKIPDRVIHIYENQYNKEKDPSLIDMTNYTYFDRAQKIQSIISNISIEGATVTEALLIAKLFVMQANYLSIFPNRLWIIYNATSTAWLKYASFLDRNNIYRKSILEIQKLIDFNLYCRVPGKPLSPEAITINKVFHIEVTNDRKLPPIQNLYEVLVRKRLYTNIRDTWSSYWNYARDNYYETKIWDIGNIIIWGDHRNWYEFDQQGAYRVSNYNQYSFSVQYWFSSFSEILFKLFPDSKETLPSGINWDSPWNDFDLLYKELTGSDLTTEIRETLHTQKQVDLIGFGHLKLWENRIKESKFVSVENTYSDILINEFILLFQNQLKAHYNLYWYWGNNQLKKFWKDLESHYNPINWLSTDRDWFLAKGLEVNVEFNELAESRKNLQKEIDQSVESKELDKAETLARELMSYGILFDTDTLLIKGDIKYSITGSPLGYFLYKKGNTEEVLKSIASLVTGSNGVEKHRKDILILSKNLNSWDFYFQEGRNSQDDYLTRSWFYFLTERFYNAQKLVNTSKNHYGAYKKFDTLNMSIEILQQRPDSTSILWDQLKESLVKSDIDLRLYIRWFRVMDKYLEDLEAWKSFKANYKLDLLAQVYDTTIPYYTTKKVDNNILNILKDMAELSKKFTEVNEISKFIHELLIIEWGTLLGRYINKYYSYPEFHQIIKEQLYLFTDHAHTLLHCFQTLGWTYRLNEKFITLIPAVRAVRYGTPSEYISDLFISSNFFERAEELWTLDTGYTPADLIMIQSANLFAKFLNKIDSNSNKYCLDDIQWSNLENKNAFETLFKEGKDQLAIDLAFYELKDGGNVQCFYPYISFEKWVSWCRENAYNYDQAQEWINARNENDEYIKELLESRTIKLPETFPLYINWLQKL